MADISIIQMDTYPKSGEVKVSMNIIEALEEHHNLELICAKRPDLEFLNRYYDCDINDIDIEVISGSHFCTICEQLNRFAAVAIFRRFAKEQAGNADLVISPRGELSIDGPVIQYIHYPWNLSSCSKIVRNAEKPVKLRVKECIQNLGFRHISKFSWSSFVTEAKILTNSVWSSERIRSRYACNPEVLYPPAGREIHSGGRDDWGRRERGFLSIGRVVPYKKYNKVIDIIVGLRNQGHDVHLHIIGRSDQAIEYATEIEERCRKYDFIHFEGEVDRRELDHMLNTHRFGIHATKDEHFGIAIAEMCMNGIVPFVPDSGGQREVVDNKDALTFSDTQEAIESIESIIGSGEVLGIQDDLLNHSKNFSKDRFQGKIMDIVDDLLNGKGQ